MLESLLHFICLMNRMNVFRIVYLIYYVELIFYVEIFGPCPVIFYL